MDNKVFKILSIDGGGIKGIYSATILNEFENKYGKIGDYFDLVCGTSTGALIALGIASGKSMQEILDFYHKDGPKIFKKNNLLSSSYLFLKQLFIKSKYSNKKLRESLEKIFDDKELKDSNNYLCIPTTNITNSLGVVFKTPHASDIQRDKNRTMVEVGLATSAAPTFFQSVSIKDKFSALVDGGIWSNNPSLIGAIEAITYFVGKDKEYSKFSILSIGNLSTVGSTMPYLLSFPSIISWGSRLFSLVISSQSNAMHNLLNIAFKNDLFPMGSYYRIGDPQKIETRYIKYLKLDNASKEARSILTFLANNEADYHINKEEIKSFFNEKKSNVIFY